MDISQFIEEYTALSATERVQFAETVYVLMDEGLIWREDGTKRQVYLFLHRHADLIAGYLSVARWELRHHEQCQTFQVVHKDGAHHKRFDLETTIWLLLLRLLYAEQQESTAMRQTRYPTVTVGTLIERYLALPHARKHIKTRMAVALTQLQQFPIIRAASGGTIRIDNVEQVIELLPPLEVIVPANDIATVAARLAEHFQKHMPSTNASDVVEDLDFIEEDE